MRRGWIGTVTEPMIKPVPGLVAVLVVGLLLGSMSALADGIGNGFPEAGALTGATSLEVVGEAFMPEAAWQAVGVEVLQSGRRVSLRVNPSSRFLWSVV